MRGRFFLSMAKIRITAMIVHDHPLYVFIDVSAAQIFRVIVSHEMKKTFILAFLVRISQTIHPFFIVHLSGLSLVGAAQACAAAAPE